MEIGCCGADCRDCEMYLSECPGCRELEGKVYWTEYTGEPCPIYTCCAGKGLSHCGKCAELPCEHYRENTDPRLSDEEKESILEKCILALTLLG